MLALRILDLKDFTGKLFIGEMFQHFSFVEASFTTFVTYTLDGQLHKEFFDSEQKPMRTYCLWEDVQAQCFSIFMLSVISVYLSQNRSLQITVLSGCSRLILSLLTVLCGG